MSNFSSLLLLIVIVLILPAALAFTLFYFARIAKAGWLKGGLTLLGMTLSIGVMFLLVNVVPYFWAGHLESKWTAAHPQSRTEMEFHLSLYSMREIHPAQSGWGSNHSMQPGDKMIQYLLFWTQPLEVVYDKDDQLIATYTSYE